MTVVEFFPNASRNRDGRPVFEGGPEHELTIENGQYRVGTKPVTVQEAFIWFVNMTSAGHRASLNVAPHGEFLRAVRERVT